MPVRTQGADLSVGDSQLRLGGRSLASTGFIDITRDGKRILLSRAQPNPDTALTLVLKWQCRISSSEFRDPFMDSLRLSDNQDRI